MHGSWIRNDLHVTAAPAHFARGLLAPIRLDQLVVGAIQHKQRRTGGAVIDKAGDTRCIIGYMAHEAQTIRRQRIGHLCTPRVLGRHATVAETGQCHPARINLWTCGEVGERGTGVGHEHCLGNVQHSLDEASSKVSAAVVRFDQQRGRCPSMRAEARTWRGRRSCQPSRAASPQRESRGPARWISAGTADLAPSARVPGRCHAARRDRCSGR